MSNQAKMPLGKGYGFGSDEACELALMHTHWRSARSRDRPQVPLKCPEIQCPSVVRRLVTR